jgi:hypothetical protein
MLLAISFAKARHVMRPVSFATLKQPQGAKGYERLRRDYR